MHITTDLGSEPVDLETDSGSDFSLVDASEHTQSPHQVADSEPKATGFQPTVPRAQSGSPKKAKDAPLDPQRPQGGMMFNALEEAVHFVYQYESHRGYVWKKGESECNKQGAM